MRRLKAKQLVYLLAGPIPKVSYATIMLSQTPENSVDVLVIGAGPAGLMCGNALAAAGDIKLRVIDQRCVQPDQVFGQSDMY